MRLLRGGSALVRVVMASPGLRQVLPEAAHESARALGRVLGRIHQQQKTHRVQAQQQAHDLPGGLLLAQRCTSAGSSLKVQGSLRLCNYRK